MPTLLAALLLALGSGACATDPNWSWRHEQDAAVAAPAPRPPAAPPAATSAAAKPAAAVALPVDGPLRPLKPGPPSYHYGAKFEPPDGRILHGMGQWIEGNKNYIAALDNPAIDPAAMLIFVDVGDWPRSWDTRIRSLTQLAAGEISQGRMLHVSVALRTVDGGRGAKARPIDVEIANGSTYDDHIRELADTIRTLGAPTLVRIGFEFSGTWNGYTPYVYPRAYRHVVDIFREEQVDNAAFVWCWEGSCPGDFDEKGPDGARWYPGDDVVDWFGVDLFAPTDFKEGTARRVRNERNINTQRFLDMAELHRRPVVIAECGAVTVGITPDVEDGRRDWNAWFEPFFQLMVERPGIKAFFYCNSDWKGNKNAEANGWQDGDISHNDYIAKRYARLLTDPVFLHKGDLPLLRDWKTPPTPPAVEAPPPGRGIQTAPGR